MTLLDNEIKATLLLCTLILVQGLTGYPGRAFVTFAVYLLLHKTVENIEWWRKFLYENNYSSQSN